MRKFMKYTLVIILTVLFISNSYSGSDLYLIDTVAEQAPEVSLRAQANELRAIFNDLSVRSEVQATLLYSTNTDINAFATESGDEKLVVVYEGLLGKLENDRDAVAAVLGHELAHHKADHIRKAKRKRKGMAFFWRSAWRSCRRQSRPQ